MRLDLHIHTTASDGSLSPGAVLEAAGSGGLDVIAVADHDTAAGSREAIRLSAGPVPLHVVPAIELSSTWRGREIHVLGYFIDLESEALRVHEERSIHLRSERMREMVDRLGHAGVEVAFEDVLDVAGPERSTLGRPHLARVLVRDGHAADVADAFDRFIGDGQAAFVPTDLLEPPEAARVITAAGGIAVWAHPPPDLLDELLPPLMEAGLRGLEVYRPFTPPDNVRRLEEVTRRRGLLRSGGSDWHAPGRGGNAIGDFHVTAEEVAELLEAGGL